MEKESLDYVNVLNDFPKLSKTLDVTSLGTKYNFHAATVKNHERAFGELEFKLKGNKTAFKNILKCLDYNGKQTRIATKHHISTSMSGDFLEYLGIIKKIENSDDYTWNDCNRSPEEITLYYLTALKNVSEFQKARKAVDKSSETTVIMRNGSISESVQSEINFPEQADNQVETIDTFTIDDEVIENQSDESVSELEMMDMIISALTSQSKENSVLIANAISNLASAINGNTEAIKKYGEKIEGNTVATYKLAKTIKEIKELAETGK
jgi:hypothetical protein